MQGRIANSIELFNQTIILFTTYFMLLYSDFVGSVEGKYALGWWNLFMLLGLIFVSAAIIFSQQAYGTYRNLRIKWLKRKIAKKIKEIMVAKMTQRLSKLSMTAISLDQTALTVTAKVKNQTTTVVKRQTKKEAKKEQKL